MCAAPHCNVYIEILTYTWILIIYKCQWFLGVFGVSFKIDGSCWLVAFPSNQSLICHNCWKPPLWYFTNLLVKISDFHQTNFYLKKSNYFIFVYPLYSLQNCQWLSSHPLLFKLFKSHLLVFSSWHSLSRKLNLGLTHALSKGCSIPLLWCPSWPIFLAMFLEFVWIIYMAW